MKQGHWFTSEKFEIIKDEDLETNPGCYGKSLAIWLGDHLYELGYKTEVIPEDWGWCVLCHNPKFSLWVGCGVMQTEDFDPNNPPSGSSVVWHVFPHIEVPIFMFKSKIQKLLGKLDTKTPLQKLSSELTQILESEPEVKFCAEP